MLKILSKDELLKLALKSDIIDFDDIAKSINAMENKKILESHPYKIWKGKDNKYRTHVLDDTKQDGRKLIARATLESLQEAIVQNYKENHEQRVKINQIFNDWMKFSRETGSLSLGTISRYENDFNKFLKPTPFAKKDIRTVSETDVIKLLKDIVRGRKDEDKLTQKCFGNIKIVINGIFTYAKSEAEIECISIKESLQNFKLSNIHFKHVIHKDSEQVYTDEELDKLINHILSLYINRKCNGTRELGILLTILTGIRVGELVALKISDEEDKKLYIQRTESKGKDAKGKTITYLKPYPKTVESMNGIEMSDSAMEVWNWIKKINYVNGIKSEYMFYEQDIGRLHQHNFRTTLEKLCKECDIPFKSMHKFRKTYSSILIANDVEKRIVQSQMRHRSFETTEKHYLFSTRSREYRRNQINKADIINIKQREKELVRQAL